MLLDRIALRRRKQIRNDAKQGSEPVVGHIEKHGLFIIEPKASVEADLVDIVAVHGLGGDAFATWQDGNGQLWLRDFLPFQIPNARIMSYGYHSKVTSTKSVAGIDEFSIDLLERLQEERVTNMERSRPIIFICHSLGGIVVKKALILAHERSSLYGGLSNKVFGVVFMATPHRGSSVATWAKIVATAKRSAQLGRGTNVEVLAVLQHHSKVLSEISSQFVERGTNLQISTFYETEALDYLNSVIVNKESAVLNHPNEKKLPVKADHKGICRFSSADSQKYRPVWIAIKELVENALCGKDDDSRLHLDLRIVQSLHTSDYEGYRKTIPDRTEGTCTWILLHPLYTRWLEEPRSSFLWVSGDPGCGKTVLASFLVDVLKASAVQASTPTTTCFFFCDEKIDSQCDGASILAALLHQMFCSNKNLIQHATEPFETKSRQLVLKFRSLWEMFKAVNQDPKAGNIIVLIDALDECEASSRAQLIHLLADYLNSEQNSNRASLKVLVTSRGYQSIEDTFKTTLHIRMKTEDNLEQTAEDVVRFIRLRITEIQTLTSCPDEFKRDFETRLIDKAGGTFLWVSVVLDILRQSTDASLEGFERIIESMPSELDGVYETILNKTTDPEKQKRILGVLIACRRPLTLAEINIALGVQISSSDRDQSWNSVKRQLQWDMGRTLKAVCGPFLRIANGTVYLVHQTAKEFLVQSSLTQVHMLGSWKHSLRISQSHRLLAEICCHYLQLDIFSSRDGGIPRLDTGDIGVYQPLSPDAFLDYASKFWGYHFRMGDITKTSALIAQASQLCDTQSTHFRTWFHLYWTTISPDETFPAGMTPLMILAHLGLKEAVSLDLNGDPNVNAQDSEGWAALHWAVWEGHSFTYDGTEAVQLLLDAGADVQAPDNVGLRPLHWAAADGQEDVMCLLLRAGALIDATDCQGSTALHAAVENGQNGAVKLLLANGADVDAICGGGYEDETQAPSNNEDMEMLDE
ncbi:hypothetical protein AUP68_08419 [Ilyonectria robusta]